MLELTLFGTGQARYCGRLLPGFPSQQPHLLLCYLLLNRHKPHHREHLAAVFWSEYPTSVSRKYLRNTLWRLRNVLQSAGVQADGYLRVENGNVAFVASDHCWLDIEEFEKTVTRYQDLSGRELTADQAEHLEETIGLYTGDLLEGIYEDWCLYDRERLHLLYLAALNKLMTFHEANGTYEHGLACGERILACDNTREKTHRQMMRLHWLLGDRNSAMAQYKRCAQILREAIGVSPTEETQRLYQQMRLGQFDPAHWANRQDASPTGGIGTHESTRLMAEQALQGLHQLQAAVEQMGNELLTIEHQLSTALHELI